MSVKVVLTQLTYIQHKIAIMITYQSILINNVFCICMLTITGTNILGKLRETCEDRLVN